MCVVGAGTAGLEGLLSARQRFGADAELRLIAPEREFRYRPMSADSLFRPTKERGIPVGDLVAMADARWVAQRAAAVYEGERRVLTRDGDTVDFDFLLLAMGAQPRRALRQGYVWQRGGDPGFLDEIVLGIAAGDVRSVAVAVPRGARWPLPAYELALILAWSAGGSDAEVALITAEQEPLAALGRAATEAVTGELAAAGVKTVTGVEAVDEPRREKQTDEPAEVMLVPEPAADDLDVLSGKPTDPASVRLGASSVVGFDRLISLPTVIGPGIAGVAVDAVGFVEVDEALAVCGSERVWAAGGCIAAALEHSALAARQADAAVAAMAAASGGRSAAKPIAADGEPELTGVLLRGQREQWMAENPRGTLEPSTRCLWWPPGRAVGRMLAQRIAAWDPSVQQALPGNPDGVPIRVPVALGCGEPPPVSGGGQPSADVRMARLRDIENRQLMAMRRAERDADAQLRTLRTQLDTLAKQQRAVIRELRQHGYLHERGAEPTTDRPTE